MACKCFTLSPAARPTFSDLAERLEGLGLVDELGPVHEVGGPMTAKERISTVASSYEYSDSVTRCLTYESQTSQGSVHSSRLSRRSGRLTSIALAAAAAGTIASVHTPASSIADQHALLVV
jgi:hypothetical protein